MKPRLILRLGELFVGAGGLSLGLILADHPHARFQPLFAVDNDEESLSSYEHNLKWLSRNARSILSQMPKVIKNDVQEVNVSELLDELQLKVSDLDLLVGGSPCQGFSSSNRGSKKKKRSEQNSLIKSFLDKLNEFRPKMFLIENVQGVGWTKVTPDMRLAMQQSLPAAVANHKSVKEFLIQQATSLGYQVWHGLINAESFGVPQNRVRFILFGVRRDLADETTTINLASYLEKYQTETPTVRDAISDLPRIGNGERWNGDVYHPSDNEYVVKMRRFMLNGDLSDHFTTKHSQYVLDRFRQIPQGGNWESIKKQIKNYRDIEKTHSNIYRRLIYKAPAHTISHYRKSMTIHPRQNRGLSMREACRLQSFPDWFQFQGKVDNQQQQLANAVPPLMASAIGRAIADFWLDHLSRNAQIIAKQQLTKG